MDHRLASDELVLRKNLPTLGIGRRELAKAEKGRELVKIRRGVWVAKRPLSVRERHQQDVRAALAGRADGAVVSHLSAAAFHGLPLPSKLDTVWLTRPGRRGGGHHRSGIQVVRAPLQVSEWGWQEDLKVTTMDRTTIDIARNESFVMGVMVADAALRGGCTPGQLRAALERARRWPGMAKARQVVDFADARSESPYESWMRVLLSELDLGELTPQLVINDEHGNFVARVDAALEDRKVAFEYDGEAKYDELLQPGQRPQDAFRAEKERDRKLNRLGWWTCHYSKLDVHDRSRFRRVTFEALENARKLQGSGR